MDLKHETLENLLEDLQAYKRLHKSHVSPNKELGRYETPLPLVQFIAAMVAGCLGEKDKKASGPLTVVDPATGDGRFIRQLDRVFDGKRHGTQYLSFDVTSVMPERTGLNSHSEWTHVKEDALQSKLLDENCADAVLGNPPYVGGLHMSPKMRAQYQDLHVSTSIGDWNLYGLFLELGYKWLKPGGVLGMIVPSSWMRSKSMVSLRNTFQKESALLGVIDFGDLQLFENATTYSSVVFLQKPECKKSETFEFATWHQGKWNIETRLQSEAFLHGHHSGSKVLPTKISNCESRVENYFSVYKGVGTGANSIFIRKELSKALDQEECWKLVWMGRDIGRLNKPIHRLLLPYDGLGKLLPPYDLERNHPNTWEYLISQRDTLGAREKGKFHGRFFYGLGRPNSLVKTLAKNERLLVPDVTKKIRTTLDVEGHVFADSVVAIEPFAIESVSRCKALEILKLLLESGLCAVWLAKHGVPLKGGYTRMTPNTVSKMPFPSSLLDGDIGDPECLNKAFDLPLSQWRLNDADVGCQSSFQAI